LSEGGNVKYLVTGAAGFLGSHLSKRLLAQGHEVVGLDNLMTGHKSNLNDIQDHRDFHFIYADVTQPMFIEVDGIFNLACPASPVKYQKNPVQTFKTNVHGAINILDLATRLKVPVFQASTSEIYGDPAVSPQPESYWGNVNPIGIRSCYDEGKRAAETLFFDYFRQYATQIYVARIFNTYGPQMAIHDGRVVSNFIVQALTNRPITVYGDGLQTRSLCFVDDLIDGILFLFNSEFSAAPINLGNPEPITVVDLAKEIIQLTNSKSEIIFEALPSDDPTNREPDISIARAKLKWNPKVSRTDGLNRTINYFREAISSN
jgi:UDP-glucuronate decarboxylase